MSYSRQRYFQNQLEPVVIDGTSLKKTLKDLHSAIVVSVDVLSANFTNEDARDSLYVGISGIGLMFLRLASQYQSAGLYPDEGLGDFKQLIPRVVEKCLSLSQPSSASRVREGHLSPLDTTVGPALLRIFGALDLPRTTEVRHGGDVTWRDEWKQDVQTLRRAVDVAVNERELGGDEILCGRAGLLWALLNLRARLVSGSQDISESKRADLMRILSGPTQHKKKDKDLAPGIEATDEAIACIVDAIIQTGREGAAAYPRTRGQDPPLPLMWPWHGKFYLGAIHGAAGILTVLLQAPPHIIAPYTTLILPSVDALCHLAYTNGGHLPPRLPVDEGRDRDMMVQICHGAPGLLPLLATVHSLPPDVPERANPNSSAESVADTLRPRAASKAADAIWAEGLVRKGLGVCHGVSGNGWALLSLAASTSGPESDALLSRALALLLHARELPPLSMEPSSLSTHPSQGRGAHYRYHYRTPDRPYSLFEGLAGAVCAWLDACVVVRARLAEMKMTRGGGGGGGSRTQDRSEGGLSERVYGIPGLGGTGVHGLF